MSILTSMRTGCDCDERRGERRMAKEDEGVTAIIEEVVEAEVVVAPGDFRERALR